MNKRLEFARSQWKKIGRTEGEGFIHPSVHIPKWVILGQNVVIHESVTLGTEGFSYVLQPDLTWLHIPHTGQVIIGDNVEIYPHSNIDRGTKDDTVIGNGTKIDHFCHIGHNCVIGENCIITARSLIGGSCRIGALSWLGTSCSILDHVTIGDRVFIGQQTNVIRDVPDDAVVIANPGKILRIGGQPHMESGELIICSKCGKRMYANVKADSGNERGSKCECGHYQRILHG